MNSPAVVAIVTLLAIWNTGASGDSCSDRVETEINPIFPRRCGETNWASENMPCTVPLTYDLSAEGAASNFELVGEVESCAEYFLRSVEKSLMKTEFSPGAKETGCVYEHTFAFE